jgi:hypothetical protein
MSELKLMVNEEKTRIGKVPNFFGAWKRIITLLEPE